MRGEKFMPKFHFKRLHSIGLALMIALLGSGLLLKPYLQIGWNYAQQRLAGSRYTLQQRLDAYREPVQQRWQPYFEQAGIAYPPKHVTLIGLKQEKELQVYAAGKDRQYRFIRSYPVLAASGSLGPKLQEGDFQVPEGIYRVEYLNPNSRFHLSLRLNYPNQFDRAKGRLDGRTRLGSDIMIHGNAVSIGCLAMGDEAAEDLFILAALTGMGQFRVILSPLDFRRAEPLPAIENLPAWSGELYQQIRAALAEYEPCCAR
jgi:hypothetical protein